jgi:hypothetical protein
MNECIIDKGCFESESRIEYKVPAAYNTGRIEMSGEWTIVRGLNRAHDCFRCSLYTWDASSPTLPSPKASRKDYSINQSIISSERESLVGVFDRAGWLLG